MRLFLGAVSNSQVGVLVDSSGNMQSIADPRQPSLPNGYGAIQNGTAYGYNYLYSFTPIGCVIWFSGVGTDMGDRWNTGLVSRIPQVWRDYLSQQVPTPGALIGVVDSVFNAFSSGGMNAIAPPGYVAAQPAQPTIVTAPNTPATIQSTPQNVATLSYSALPTPSQPVAPVMLEEPFDPNIAAPEESTNTVTANPVLQSAGLGIGALILAGAFIFATTGKKRRK